MRQHGEISIHNIEPAEQATEAPGFCRLLRRLKRCVASPLPMLAHGATGCRPLTRAESPHPAYVEPKLILTL
jgi:hypothetical protein